MKIRLSFVSNSSSCSFIIKNLSNEEKTLVDFVKENPQIIEKFRERFDWYKEKDGYTQKELVKSAENNNEAFKPGEKKECVFGDEDGTLIGHVFDYMLREGGESESFEWCFFEMLR